MHINKDTLYNKLALFSAAGYPSDTGWDTAIPQQIFDTLLSWGIEIPSSYFVMDCKSRPWALHHTGEALFAILAARSDANEEIWQETFKSSPDCDQEKALYHFMIRSPDHLILNEIQTGFLDINIVIASFNTGWVEGRRAICDEIREALKDAEKSDEAWEIIDGILGNEK
jgi:hypothetical protein